MSNYENLVDPGSYLLKNTSYYYIHRIMSDIGKLNGGNTTDIYTVFKDYKQKQVSKALKTQYANLFKNAVTQIKTDKNLYELLDYTVDPNRGDKIITEMDKVIKEELEKVGNSQNINKVLDTVQYTKVSQWKSNTIDDMTKLGKQLNEMLNILQEAFDVFREGGTKVLLSIDQQQSIPDYAKALAIAVQDYKKRLEDKRRKFSLTSEQINHVLSKMDSLVNALLTGKTSTGGTITYNVLKHLFDQYIFSTGIGEAIAYKASDLAKSTIIQGMAENLNLSGGETTKIQLFDEEGKPISELEGKKTYGKADIQFSNVAIHLENIDEIGSGTLTMTIGISNKLYKTISFREGNEQDPGEFSVGGGLTLDQALREAFGSDQKKLYLAYNIFGYHNKSSIQDAVINLQDIIFTRSIMNIFSSRGLNDFSGYLLLNGKIISVWEIIQYALETNIGISHSGQRNLGDNATGISFSLGSSEQHNALIAFQSHKSWSPEERANSVDTAIKGAGLHGYIRPAKLLQALKGKMKT